MRRAKAARKLRRIGDLLRGCYGPRRWRSSGSALGELVATVLSQNTTSRNAAAGFRQLWRRFRSWRAVANAPVEEIERCIRVCGLSRIKAPRIRDILRVVRERGGEGKVSLEFLRRWPVRRAEEYLLGFGGVGPKTAACVLLFAFGKKVFPVDTHIRRIAVRVGLLPAGTSAESAQRVLEPWIAPDRRYEMHLLLIAHGRRLCRARNPRCDVCPLRRLCLHARARAGNRRAASVSKRASV